MTEITAGALVTVRQFGAVLWVVKQSLPDHLGELNRWRCTCKQTDKWGRMRYQNRDVGAGDITLIRDAATYEPGQTITYRGEACTIERDDGDHVVITTPAFAKKLYRGRGWVQHPEGSKSVSKAALLLDNEL